MVRMLLVPRSAIGAQIFLPQPHHAAFGIREERKRAHTGHCLLLDVDLAAGRANLLA